MDRNELGLAVASAFGLPFLGCIGIFLLIEFAAILCGGRLPWWPKDCNDSLWKDVKGFFVE